MPKKPNVKITTKDKARDVLKKLPDLKGLSKDERQKAIQDSCAKIHRRDTKEYYDCIRRHLL